MTPVIAATTERVTPTARLSALGSTRGPYWQETKRAAKPKATDLPGASGAGSGAGSA